jgi:hypothetical protein
MIIRDRSVEETEGILVSRAIWNQMAADIEQLKSQVKVIVSLLAAEADLSVSYLKGTLPHG